MERKEWVEIKNKVSKLHIGMETNLNFLQVNAERMKELAQRCDVRLIGYLSRFSQLATIIRKDAEELRAKGILNEMDYNRFMFELATYHDEQLDECIEKLAHCCK